MKAIAAKQPSNDATRKHKVKEQTPGTAGASVFSSPDIAIQHMPMCPCGGGCPRCSGVIQPKLMVNQPGDIYEQEADRIADQMMATPAHQAVSGASPRVQRFSGQLNGQMDAAPASVYHALASPGMPLDTALRQDMEQRFGNDFSGVRMHSGEVAEQSARAVNANAYTVGYNIVFGADLFALETHQRQQLLAHELVHVIQQVGGENTQQHRGNTVGRSTPSLSQISDNSNSRIIQRQKGKKAPAAGKQIVIIANGYPGYSSDKKEIEESQKGLWLPNTLDFTTTASDTQKHFSGASTADEFFGALQTEKDKIKRVVFIGHGNPTGLGLSGKPMSWFEKSLVQSDLTRWQNSIDSDIKPKFLEDATLDIYACNVAAGGAFINALAQALGICVRGFTGAVYWCLGYDGDAITSRGRIADRRVAAECSDKRWSKGVNKLKPPDKTCP